MIISTHVEVEKVGGIIVYMDMTDPNIQLSLWLVADWIFQENLW